jgi:hypothetical protein
MADPKPRIYTGTEWLDLQGPEGPTVVSSDPNNVCRLGTDGKLLVSQPDLDAIYVNLAGDTMTGALAIKAPQPTGGDGVASLTTVAAESGRAISRITNAGDSESGPYLIFRKDRGTLAAPALLKSGDELGFVRFNVASGTSERNVGLVAAYAMSNAVTTGCDTRIQLQSLASDPAKPAAFLTLDNYTATGRVFQVGSDNFSVGVASMTIAGAVAGTLATNGIAASFRSNGNGNGQAGLGVLGAAAGTSATSGGVTGVRGEVTGTVNTGIGVSADVTATATQNYGFAAVVRGGTRNCGLYVDVPKGTGSYAVQFQGDADSYFKSNVGIGWSTPSVLLEVGGATKLRTTLEVVGNITSAGTAHNFAAKSIPASAINGVPTLKANDLTDVTVNAPAVGQVLRFDGTNFVNTKLNFSDLSGTIVNPTINAPSIFKVIELAAGSPEPRRACVIPAAPPVTSATITGVQGYWFAGGVTTSQTAALILGKVNTVTKVFTGGISTYSGWVSLALGADEKHACVFGEPFPSTIDNNLHFIRFYTPSENSNWSTGVRGSLN